jgi:aldehyde:ferredoxin oxidoreductase
MAGLHGSPESSGSTVSDHQTTRNQHQTVEKGNANTSTLFRKATTVRGQDAAREGGGAIAGSRKLLKLVIQSTTNLKKSMGRERRRWLTHQNEEGLKSTRKPRR